MGRRAVKLLLERLRDGPRGEPLEIVLRPKLIVRRTGGALAAGQNAASWIEDYAHPAPDGGRS
jgi:hypothetical protein